MKGVHFLYLLAILLCMVLLGCHSPSETAPSYFGSVQGWAKIYQNEASSLPSVGISIKLDSGELQTLSDSDGHWVFNDVPIGTHIITASKMGFGLTRCFNVQVSRNGLTTTWNFGLFAVPNDTVHLDSLRLDTLGGAESAELYVFHSVDSSNTVTVLVDTSITAEPADAHLLMWESDKPEDWTDLANLREKGIRAGTVLYVSACETNYGDGQGGVSGEYFDPVDNSLRLVSPGPKSNIVKFRMP